MTDPVTTQHPDSPSDERERFEQQADEVREHLISNIKELSHRTQRVERLFSGWVERAKRHKTPLIAVGVGIAALSLVVLFKQRAAAKRHERWRRVGSVAMQLLGVSPPPPKEPGFVRKSVAGLGSLAAGIAVHALQQGAIRAVEGVVAQSDPAESGDTVTR